MHDFFDTTPEEFCNRGYTQKTRPYDVRGISKRTIKSLVISVGFVLEENPIGFEKLGFQNVLLATRKRKAGVFKSSSGLRSAVFVMD